MFSIRAPRSVVGLLAAAALTSASHSGFAQTRQGSEAAADLRQEPSRQEPSTLAISIPWQWLAATGGTMSFQCQPNRPGDDEGVRMVEALTRDGRRARYAGKGDDGGTFIGSRNGDDFTFEAISKESARFAMQMPWVAARCMFGGARLAGTSSVDLRAREIGGRVRLELAGAKKGVSVEVK